MRVVLCFAHDNRKLATVDTHPRTPVRTVLKARADTPSMRCQPPMLVAIVRSLRVEGRSVAPSVAMLDVLPSA
jgi:hypothetical protein